MYYVLSIGVNYGPGADLLRFAEKDAIDIFRVLSGALGPPRVGGKCLLGARATRAEMIAALNALAWQPPEHLLLYFSGHGSEEGILLADGLLHYDELADYVRIIRARAMMTILDTCHAAAYGRFVSPADVAGLGGIDEDLTWLRVLSEAHPGMRMLFATSAETLSRESPNAKNGFFTAALLHAFHHAEADLPAGSPKLISDLQAFVNACAFMQEQQTKNWKRPGSGIVPLHIQQPQFLGHLGDFPLVRSQVERAVGTATITNFAFLPGLSMRVDFVVNGRRNVPTRWRVRLSHPDGSLIDGRSHRFVPAKDEHADGGQIRFPVSVLDDDFASSFVLDSGRQLPVRWTFELLDDHGHQLARRSLMGSYFKGAPMSQLGW
ncbi:caspase family protein [Sorangium sp. So ce117]|uniref:caspase family protein n=1 Tax=Sorangium sp. So ce117 TaxID=3133277 RepID=UPI003F6254B3